MRMLGFCRGCERELLPFWLAIGHPRGAPFLDISRLYGRIVYLYCFLGLQFDVYLVGVQAIVMLL